MTHALGAGTALCLSGTLPLASAHAAPSAGGSSDTAPAVRFGDHGPSARVVLELDVDAPYSWFLLPDPYRLVIDIHTPGLTSARLPGKAVSFLKGIRQGTGGDGIARFVVDLAKPALLDNVFVIPPRGGHAWRLVADLVPAQRDAFLAALQTDTARGGTALAQPSPQPQAPAQPSAAPQPLVPTPAAGAPTSPTAPPRLAGSSPTLLVQPAPAKQPTAQTARPTEPSVSAQPALPEPPQPNIRQQLAHAFGPDSDIPIPQLKPPAPAGWGQRRKHVVVLDPGHGGRDPGAIGASGLFEKKVTLDMARELRKTLEATGRYKVVMTRTKDVSVRLRDRVARARHAGGDLFISLHADALRNRGVRGLSVYTLSETASDAEAAALAERENKADILLGLDLSHESKEVTDILIDLAQRETKNRSVTFANTLIGHLPTEVNKLNKTRRYAGFAVLKAPDIPSVLVEMGFLSNSSDEKLLKTPAYRSKLARAITQGVDAYFQPTTQDARRP